MSTAFHWTPTPVLPSPPTRDPLTSTSEYFAHDCYTAEDIETWILDALPSGDGFPSSLASLISFLEHPSRRVRRAATMLIASTCPSLFSTDSVAALLALLHRDDWGVRRAALQSLALHPSGVLAAHGDRFAALVEHEDWGASSLRTTMAPLRARSSAAATPAAPQLRRPQLHSCDARSCDAQTQRRPQL